MRGRLARYSLIFALTNPLVGCANFDNDAFQRTLAQAYVYNQVMVQPRVDALNNMSSAQALRMREAGPVYLYDYEWDWDEFYNEQYQLVWACRGVQTGQFANQAHCTNLPRTDLRWPDKRK